MAESKATSSTMATTPLLVFQKHAGLSRSINAGADHALARSPPYEQSDLTCLGTEDDDYTTPSSESCWRVLWSNPPMGDAEARARIFRRRLNSVVGQFGHSERFSAWSHLIGAVGFLLFALIRPWTPLDSESTSGRLASYSAIVTALVFFTSTAYHTLGTARWLSAAARLFDHAAIDVAVGVANLCDLSIATRDFNAAHWTTVADPIAVAMAILLFFLYRRSLLSPAETESGWGSCKLGLFRMQHSDREHGALRSATYVCTGFMFILIAPMIAALPSGHTLVYCNAISVVLLMLGLYIDSVLMLPDKWYQQGSQNLCCSSKNYGCIINSHGLWHVLCLIACLLQTVGREVVIDAVRTYK